MALEVTYDPESGLPHFKSDGPVVYVGPHISGHVTTTDGTRVNVNPLVVEAESDEHAAEIAHLVALRLENEDHPLHDESDPFLHHCTEACGPAARPPSDPSAAAAAVRAQTQTSAIPDAETRAHHAAALGTGAGDNLSMARASAAAENAALNGLDGTGATNVIPDVSLHTADVGTTGASENANTGSYARQACSWNAASGGAKTNSTSLTFSTAGSVQVTYFGTWSSATYGAGNYAIGGALAAGVTATSITIAAGALSIGAS